MSEMIYRAVRWLFGLIGFVPVGDALRAHDFEATLMALLPSEEDRERFREGALMLAQAGVNATQMEALGAALARGAVRLDGGSER